MRLAVRLGPPIGIPPRWADPPSGITFNYFTSDETRRPLPVPPTEPPYSFLIAFTTEPGDSIVVVYRPTPTAPVIWHWRYTLAARRVTFNDRFGIVCDVLLTLDHMEFVA